jgi:hypothetical protein
MCGHRHHSKITSVFGKVNLRKGGFKSVAAVPHIRGARKFKTMRVRRLY